mmetsp:Transcript_26519/g.70743  ORF Transcript_26519/g.70743 Transcript_26519/m.70743 type:complete len:493 (-) Transcript_26519:1170-2648(-)
MLAAALDHLALFGHELAHGRLGVALLLLAEQTRVERQVRVGLLPPGAHHVARGALFRLEALAQVGAKVIGRRGTARLGEGHPAPQLLLLLLGRFRVRHLCGRRLHLLVLQPAPPLGRARPHDLIERIHLHPRLAAREAAHSRRTTILRRARRRRADCNLALLSDGHSLVALASRVLLIPSPLAPAHRKRLTTGRPPLRTAARAAAAAWTAAQHRRAEQVDHVAAIAPRLSDRRAGRAARVGCLHLLVQAVALLRRRRTHQRLEVGVAPATAALCCSFARLALGDARGRVIVLAHFLLAHVRQQPVVRLGSHVQHSLVAKPFDEPLHEVAHLHLQVRVLVGAPEQHRRHETRQQRLNLGRGQRGERHLGEDDGGAHDLLRLVLQQGEHRREELRGRVDEVGAGAQFVHQPRQAREGGGHHVRRVASKPGGDRHEEGADGGRLLSLASASAPLRLLREVHQQVEGGGARLGIHFARRQHHLAQKRRGKLLHLLE